MAIKKYDVVILGAGVSGLACADYLTRNSNKYVLVLERNNYFGGLASTQKHNGYLYDLGPHRWYTRNKELTDWVDTLMGKEMITVTKNTPIYQSGKWFEYPIRVENVLRNLGWIRSVVVVGAYAIERVRARIYPRKIVTAEDAFVYKFGRVLYGFLVKEYSEKFWGQGSMSRISADLVENTDERLEIKTTILRMLGIKKKVVWDATFRYPKRGIGSISEMMVKRISKKGGKVNLNEELLSITKIKTGYRLVTNRAIYEARKIVSTIPIDNLMGMLTSKFVKGGKKIPVLGYISQKFVALFIKANKITDYNWVYIHLKRVMATRLMEMGNWSPFMSSKGKTCVVMEYPYIAGDKIDLMSDRNLVKVSIKDFLEHFAGGRVEPEAIVGTKVHRVLGAYPIYSVGYEKKLGEIKSYLEKKFKGLYLAGRTGTYYYSSLDYPITSGWQVARIILSGSDNKSPE